MTSAIYRLHPNRLWHQNIASRKLRTIDWEANPRTGLLPYKHMPISTSRFLPDCFIFHVINGPEIRDYQIDLIVIVIIPLRTRLAVAAEAVVTVGRNAILL